MTARTSTGIDKLDEMLGGGLLPGTLCVAYGATGIGKTHLGLHFAHGGQGADGPPGIFFDMNARGDSQQHSEYAARLYGWTLERWTHTVTPMADPYPSAAQMAARYCDALPWVGKLRDYQVPASDGGLELDWNWKSEYNHAMYTVRPFVYFHLGAGCRRIVVDGIEPMDVPGDYIQAFLFDELYRKVIHRDSETLGMEICLPVWKHREFIDRHRYDHAAVTTVLLVSLYRTPASLEAAWKYFILCGVGIAQALFGTILLYFAAEKVLGPGGTSLLWTHLYEVRHELEPTVLSLAFVFLLVGYGTKVGLAPLHNWLPDAHAEGPTPISAVLSGLLLNVALYAVVRSKVLVDGALERNFSGNLMMGFGLLSVVVAAFFLSRQKDIKRMFAYSSIEHMGIMTFAFGMGGTVAAFAGLLHMTVHSLTKSAIFYTVGHAAQATGTQEMASIRGLIQQSPAIGWGLALGTLAILGMPPFGVFTSEFMVLTTAMHEHSWATPFLLVALGVAFAAIFSKVQPMVFGETEARRLPHPPALIPVFVHLAIVLLLGLYIPPYLVDWYRQAAALIG